MVEGELIEGGFEGVVGERGEVVVFEEFQLVVGSDFVVDLWCGEGGGLENVDYRESCHVLYGELVLRAHAHVCVGEHELALYDLHLTPLSFYWQYELVHVVSVNLKLFYLVSESVRVCYSCHEWLSILSFER